MKEKENNEVIINAADFKFTDFSNSVLNRVDKNQYSENWFVKLRELDAKIHSNNLQDKINLTDDRLVLSAYKILIQTNIFDESSSLREWWIVKRYLEIYAEKDIALLYELQKVINMYIGFTFSKAAIDQAQKEEMKTFLKSLSEVVYEDGYIELPQFILNLIDSTKQSVVIKKGGRSHRHATQYDFSADEMAQWKGLRDTASIMLEDKESLTEEEIKNWEGALQTSLIMLDV